MNDPTIYKELDSWTSQKEPVIVRSYTPVYSEDDFPEFFQSAEWTHVPLEESTSNEDEGRHTFTDCINKTQVGVLTNDVSLNF